MSIALARLQPSDNSTASIAAAIAAIAAEQEATTARIAALREERASVLLTGTAKAVAAIEASVREGEIDLERLEILAAELQPRLAAARVADTTAALEAKRQETIAKVNDARRWFFEEYPRLANAIAEGLRRCHGAEYAAWEFGNSIGVRRPDDPFIDTSLPELPRTSVAPYGKVSPHRCVQLPAAADGTAHFWWPADLLGRPRQAGG